MDAYTTIQNPAEAEIVEKKSRFIASIAPVKTEEEALIHLESVRLSHRMARHHVYAYVLHEGRVRYSDDGEPQKTAGLPTLDVVKHAGLSDVIVVTTRYFGGTLLGTGGLVRAYTDAAKKVINQVDKVIVARCVTVSVQIPYSLYDQVIRMTQSAEVKITNSHFLEDVAIDFLLREGTEQAFLRQINEITNGKAETLVGKPHNTVW